MSRAWTGMAERGSLLGMWVTAQVYRLFGPRLTRYFILPIVAYFFVTDRRGRRASRRYLQRLHAFPGGAAALGHVPADRDGFRHYHAFGLAILDRLRFAVDGGRDVDIVFHGRQHLAGLVERKRGAVLLGAHLGSFDALRALAARNGIGVDVVMLTRHAPRVNAILRTLNRDGAARVVEPVPTTADSLFRLRASVERGGFVAILGDRVGAAARARVVKVPYLGAPAAFPAGPFVLAHALGCPIVLMIALRRDDRTYEVFAEPLAEPVCLPRVERAEWLNEIVRRYAQRLETYCLAAPYQWFNFFDFWGDEA
jgi:predicted LPLAT superfamily acyltransferase